MAILTYDGGPESPLGEASAWVEANVPSGVFCPCCGRIARQMPRTISIPMAYGIVLFHREFYGGPPHAIDYAADGWIRTTAFFQRYQSELGLTTPTTLSGGGDFTKLGYYGFIEPRGGKTGSGYWRLTPWGRQWALNLCSVPVRFLTYRRGYVIDYSSTFVTIRDVLNGSEYHYDEIIAGYI
jgi:hypothetical protein